MQRGVWSQIAKVDQQTNSPAAGVATTWASVGMAVAFGNFDGDGVADLVTGNPFAQIFDDPQAGSVVIFAARELFADGFESADTGAWSSNSE